MSPTASDLPSHPQVPSLPHPDRPESFQFCCLSASRRRPPPPAGRCPLSCPPRLPSSSWLQSSLPFMGLERPPATCPPLPRHHPPPLQTVTQHHLLLEALPALHMPTALQTRCPGRLGALRRTGQKHQPSTGQALGEQNPEIETEEEKAVHQLPEFRAARKPSSAPLWPGGQGAWRNKRTEFTFLPSPDTFPFRSNPGLVKPHLVTNGCDGAGRTGPSSAPLWAGGLRG